MSMKKTDLEKNLGKKLERGLKSQAIPQRFAQVAGKAVTKKAEPINSGSVKLVQVSCRLPAPMANKLRELAVGHEGGVSALITVAVEQYLAAGKKL